jgi:hypothetical protein
MPAARHSGSLELLVFDDPEAPEEPEEPDAPEDPDEPDDPLGSPVQVCVVSDVKSH